MTGPSPAASRLRHLYFVKHWLAFTLFSTDALVS